MAIDAPDIIYTQQFTVANAKYVEYTERDEATDVDNDYNLKNNEANIQHDEYEDVAGYLGYMDRKAATQLEEGLSRNVYPTFNQTSLNLTQDEHEKLINQISTAEKNHTLLWQGVISFDPNFLEKEGLYNEKNKKVNQRAIKKAVQESMPSFLENENLNNDKTFWWADIHLNTNHVHVHVGISQTENTRELKNGSPKGIFKTKSFRKLKSGVHSRLQNEISRQLDINLEKNLDEIKSDIVEKLNEHLDNQKEQRLMMQQIWNALPDYSDKRKWRASNNSYDFREAKLLAEKLVDDILKKDLNSEYEQFKQDLIKQDVSSRKKYGQNIQNTIQKKDKALRDYMVNRIFDNLREVDSYRRTKLSSRIESLGLERNNQLIDVLTKQLKTMDKENPKYKKLKKEIGKRKYYVKIQNAYKENEEYSNLIDDLWNTRLSSPQQTKLVNELYDRQELNLLQIKPKWRMAEFEKERLKKLEALYIPAEQVKIDNISDELVKNQMDYLNDWAKTLLVIDDPNVDIYLKASGIKRTDIKGIVNSRKKILAIKLKIRKNNERYKNNLSRKNELNGKLFNELKQELAKLQNKDIHKPKSGNKRNRSAAGRNKKFKRLEKNKSQQSTSRPPVLASDLSRALSAAKNDGQNRMQALKKLENDGDELERADQLEALEIETGRSYER